MNTSVNELLSNPAFRPLVLLDVLAVFLMIICLVFRRMRKGYYVEQANDARKATMLNIAVRNVTGMGVYSAPGYWDNGDLNLCRFERANGDAAALFSLTAVLGLLYLSSGNPQAPPNPHLRRSRVIGYAALTCLAMACLAVVTAML